MDNELFFNGGHTPSFPTAFESNSMIHVWHQLAPPSDFSPENSLDFIFDPFSSVVPSPKASDSHVAGEGLKIREKLGEFPSYYTTPLSSPPRLHSPIMAVNSNVAGFSGDPGLAERAARFSCFGSKSFNGRTSQFPSYRYTPSMADGKLSRVSRSPSLNAFGSNSSLESMVSDQISEELTCRKRKANAKGKPKEPIQFDENSNGKRNKVSEEKRYENGGGKTEEEDDGKSCRRKEKTGKTKINSKTPEPPKDYIHVRARRGQATDSHSLAERVRREKISERMNLLQDLVPGCNKVTGKALMLDEIIKYVQSLQRQVEFLSMKLASVNTRTESAMDFLISKEVFESNNSLSGTLFGNDSSPSSIYGHHNFGLQLPLINEISENFSQFRAWKSSSDHCPQARVAAVYTQERPLFHL